MILMLVTGELCITILEGKACPEAKTADLGLELNCENVQFTVHWQFINTCMIRYPVHKLIICAVSWVPTDECSSISSTFLVGFPGDQARKAQVNHSKQIKAALSATSDGDTLNLCYGFKWVLRLWLKYSHKFWWFCSVRLYCMFGIMVRHTERIVDKIW